MTALSMPTAEASTPAPTYGDVGELEQALHRAVLAERPVQHGKHDVEAEAGHPGAVVAFGPAAARS